MKNKAKKSISLFSGDKTFQSSWEKMAVRYFCDTIYLPSVFECLKRDSEGKCIGNFKEGFEVNQKYLDGKKKADAMFNSIMSSPKKIEQTVSAYIDYSRENRILELESELISLKKERKERNTNARPQS